MIFGFIFLSIFLVGFCMMIYFAIKIEFERNKRINALFDEMYLYYKNINDKESVFKKKKNK